MKIKIDHHRNQIIKRYISLIIVWGLLCSGLYFCDDSIYADAKNTSNNIIICIDPGHGGTNHGATFQGIGEKYLTLIIAKAMYHELEKYEGVRVILTRDVDEELSLVERTDMAAEAGAEFVFCLHLNASENHQSYGAEVWTSAYGEYYSKGNSFGQIELGELGNQIGVFTGRGVKTRLGSNGDYYGIINSARRHGIPAVIIEHCYMDQVNDVSYMNNCDMLRAMGRADATAVAKYFGLKSEELGVDYSNYQAPVVNIPNEVVLPDVSEPEKCQIDLCEYNIDTHKALIQMDTVDNESKIIYYSYSCDGGLTWSENYLWYFDGSGSVVIDVPVANNTKIIFRAYNQYDLYTESNYLILP